MLILCGGTSFCTCHYYVYVLLILMSNYVNHAVYANSMPARLDEIKSVTAILNHFAHSLRSSDSLKLHGVIL